MEFFFSNARIILPGTQYTNTVRAKAVFPVQPHSITARIQSLIFRFFFFFGVSFLLLGKAKKKKNKGRCYFKVVNPVEKRKIILTCSPVV